ncbi:hypothetical protein COT44_01185 [Candidatus Shapirobacteria bacterium CG08_land_8_20_14_0_20_39_18]|uniref:DUF2292 domain-containing protein n=1 Tax=Candidatus Shapirobacteria bacterium CG08_land_8_20_14_0_20_39_18 TaxID=1974883 RepID=A0A2M6XDW5_9BACT|nr:MAG: hypothetical protein COT44_01185 [Candidatus Shapirobacteria bacterium CG08_land_8_20_14_0_20_39_18]PJE68109.1 MAG: hypothetical protein COU94_03625 [Candidatus Shapirobacteria bacterium CG10_big_fil_rev_8_21_14_0_10_38_8]
MEKIQTVKINSQLIDELRQALQELNGWGSLEIYVQDSKVTQITKRVIKKTDHQL